MEELRNIYRLYSQLRFEQDEREIKEEPLDKEELLKEINYLKKSEVVNLEEPSLLNDIVSKYEISELRFYFNGKEVNVEELKKQQEFYRNFGKQEQSKNVKKFQKTSVKYDKKITTKQKKYHRKG